MDEIEAAIDEDAATNRIRDADEGMIRLHDPDRILDQGDRYAVGLARLAVVAAREAEEAAAAAAAAGAG